MRQNHSSSGSNSVADMREQMRAKAKGGKPAKDVTAGAPPPPPKAKRQKIEPVIDKREEAAERAERHAQMQHQTSLLKGKVKSVYKPDKPTGGTWSFVFQLVFVIGVCAGGAWIYETRAWEQVDWAAIKYQLKLD